MASPGRANDPAGELCTLTNCSGINFGTPRGRPKSEPYSEPKRCRECEIETLRQLNESIANMEHPRPVVPLASDTRSILNEDVLAANATFALTSTALGLILTPWQVKAALVAGAALLALNAVIRPHLSTLTRDIRVPIWLNMSGFTQASSAASKSCGELAAAAQSACANAAPAGCDKNDDCRTLLAKRAPLLACDRASLDLRDRADCPAPPQADGQKMDRNLENVKTCGLLISANPKCCPESVKTTKDNACPETPGGCARENALALSGILGRSPGVTQADCQAARDKRDAAQACGDAREAEGAQCYEGRLDAGHQKILNTILRNVRGCGAFLEGAQRFGLCP